MNNNNDSSKLILSKENENKSKNSSNKNININQEQNPKTKLDFNFTDCFKLIKHKENPYMNYIKEDINNNYRLISQKCCKNKNSFDKKQTKSKEKNNISNLYLNYLNKSESEKIFNKRINKEKKPRTKQPSTNNTTATIKKPSIKKLIRNLSCKKFTKCKFRINYEIENASKKEPTHDIGKYLTSSKKYFEKVKFNKYQYYNEKNNYYIDSRRQRIENNLNKQLLEEYNKLKPLRLTERIFYKEDNENTNKEKDRINISNNLFYSDYDNKNNAFRAINKYLFNESDNFNKCDKNPMNNRNMRMYNEKINQISNSRKNFLTGDFFNDNKKNECDLLDFDFSFLYKKYRVKKNK